MSKGLSRVFCNITVQNNSLVLSFLYGPTLEYLYMITGKTIALTRWTFVGKVKSLLFNMLSRLVIILTLRTAKYRGAGRTRS